MDPRSILGQRERTNFDRLVDVSLLLKQLIRIYESIVIEFFPRLKMHRICADVPRLDIQN